MFSDFSGTLKCRRQQNNLIEMSVCFGLLEMRGTILLANSDEFVFILWKELERTDFRKDSLWQQQNKQHLAAWRCCGCISFTLKDKHFIVTFKSCIIGRILNAPAMLLALHFFSTNSAVVTMQPSWSNRQRLNCQHKQMGCWFDMKLLCFAYNEQHMKTDSTTIKHFMVFILLLVQLNIHCFTILQNFTAPAYATSYASLMCTVLCQTLYSYGWNFVFDDHFFLRTKGSSTKDFQIFYQHLADFC